MAAIPTANPRESGSAFMPELRAWMSDTTAGPSFLTAGAAWNATDVLTDEDPGEHLSSGYDATGNIAYIRSVNSGTAFTDLHLAGLKTSIWSASGTADAVKTLEASAGSVFLENPPSFNLVSNSLAVSQIIALGSTFSVAASKTASLLRLTRIDGSDNVFNLASGSLGTGLYASLTADATSHAASNLYAAVTHVTNAGPGGVKGLHAAAFGSGSSTGGLVAGNFQIQPTATNSLASAAIQAAMTGSVDNVASLILFNSDSFKVNYCAAAIVAPVMVNTAFYQAWLATGSSTNARAYQLLSPAAVESFYVTKTGGGYFADAVGIGTSPTAILDVVKTQDAGSAVRITNASTGTSALAMFQAISNSSQFQFRMHSNTASASRYGVSTAAAAEVLAFDTSALLIGTSTNSAPIVFGINSAEVARLTTSGLSLTNLTSGRIPIASTSGLLVDDADLTWSTDTLTATKLVGSTSISTPSLIAAANLTAAPVGDWIFNAGGKDILPSVNYDQNLGALDKKYLTLHAAELWVETLVAQNTIATIGGRILVGPTTTLTTDLADTDVIMFVKHNNLASGDRVYLEVNGQVEFIAITSGPGGAGPYVHTITRDLDGTGANNWFAGDAVFNTGTTGSGFIDIYSVRGVKSSSQTGPTIVGNIRNSGTYNDWSEHWAIGNLNGLYGYGVTTYGTAFGKYAAGTPHITIDSTNGYRIFSGLSTVIGQWDNSGVITIGEVGASKDNILISSGAFSIRNNTTARLHMTAAGVMSLNDSTGAAKITLDAAAGMTLDGKMQMLGSNSAIAIGVLPPLSTTIGTGLWQDRNGIWGILGVKQVETATVVGTITGTGNAEVIVTAASMVGSPRTVLVPVVNTDTASVVAGKIRTALSADAVITAFFTVSGSGADVVLTDIYGRANDATMNIAIDNDTCTGLTPDATSTNTKSGSTTTQAKFDATTGAITAANGNITLNALGLSVIGTNLFMRNAAGLATTLTTASASGGIVAFTQELNTAGVGVDARMIFRASSSTLGGNDYTSLTMNAKEIGQGDFRFWGDNGILGATIGANDTPDAMLDVRGASGAVALKIDSNIDSAARSNMIIHNDSTTSAQVRLSLERNGDAGTGVAKGTVLFHNPNTGFANYEAGQMIFFTGTAAGAATNRFQITPAGNIILGTQAALATTATDGYVMIPTCAGTPTGVPTAATGKVGMVYDTSANKIWIYNGAWRGVVVA